MSGLIPSPQLLNIWQHNYNAANQIIQCVQTGQYCALLGPRFSGKTELLNAVKVALAQDTTWVCIYINLVDVESSTQAKFFTSLIQIIAQRIGELTSYQVPVPDTDEVSSAMFRGFLRDGVLQLKRDLVLMVDHLEAVPDELLQTLLTSLRAAYMDQQSDKYSLVTVVSGALSLAMMTVGESSPFRGIARWVFIGDLSDDESEILIAEHLSGHSLRVSPAARAWLLRAARGDPHLVKRICHRCIQIVQEGSSQRLIASTVKRVMREFVRDEAPRYEPLQEAIRLIEEDPDLLSCTLLLLKRRTVPKRELPLPLSPDLDPLYLTGIVRNVPGDGYQLRNEIYGRFLAQYYDPGRVGYLLTMAGRWDLAIDYLEVGIKTGSDKYRPDLLAATINSMYTSENIERAAYYLMRGLSAVFGLKEIRVWHTPDGIVRNLVGQLETTRGSSQDIWANQDQLEARAYREARAFRGQVVKGYIKRAIPLLIPGHKPIGVVAILDNLDSAKSTEPGELQLMSYFNQAARAIQDVLTRQHQRQQEQERRELAETLREISTVISKSLEQKQVLTVILEQMARVLPFDSASIQLLDRSSNRLKIIASKGFDDPDSVEKLTFPLEDKYPNARVWHRRKPLHFSNVRAGFLNFADPQYHVTRVRGWLGAPLLVDDEAIGVITLDSFIVDFYTSEHEQLAMTFAAQAAIAIKNANLLKAERRQREVTETLRQVAILINASLDLNTVPDRILEQVAHVVEYDSTSLRLVEGDKLIVRAIRGFEDPDQVMPLVADIKDNPLFQKMSASRRPIVISDVRTDDRYRHWTGTAQVRSWIGVPLVVRDQVIGQLVVDKAQPNFYDESAAELVFTFAQQVAIAIENARLYEAVKQELAERKRAEKMLAQRVAQLAILNDIGGQIAAVLALDTVLDQTVHLVQKSFGYHHVALFTLEQERGTLWMRTKAGSYANLFPDDYRLKVTQGMVGWVACHNQTLLANDVSIEPHHFNPFPKEKEMITQAELAVPIQVGREVVGALDAQSPHLDAFDENDVLVMETLAAQIAVAMENARLYKQMEDRAQILAGLLEGSQALTERISDRPRVVLDKIAENACKIMKAPCAVVYPYRADSESYDTRNVGSYGLRQPDKFSPKDRPREYGISLTAHIVKHGQRIVSNVNTDQDEKLKKARFIQREGILAFIGIPLCAGERSVGALFVNYREPHLFLENEIKTIEILANQAAIAILNARLYQQTSEALQKRVKEMETIQTIDDAITSTLDLQEILKLILDRTLELTEATRSEILLVSEDGQALELAARRGNTRMPIGMRLKLGESVTGRAAQDGRIYHIPDVQSPKWKHIYWAYDSGMRSELAVPMHFEGQVVGVINIESTEINAFSADDERLVEGLAKQAAIAIRNAMRYEELEKTYKELENTKDYLLASEAVAWLGLFGADWQHTINQKTFSIGNYVDALRRWMVKHQVPPDVANTVGEALDGIEEVTDSIRTVQFTGRVPSETPGEADGETIIDPELKKIATRWCNDRQDVKQVFDLNCPGISVKIPPQWLRVAMEKLINNALKAMPDGGKITIATQREDDMAHITVEDTGHGIPDFALADFLKRTIQRPEDKKKNGTGKGTIIARFVARSYGGNLELVHTYKGKGTKLLLTLPMLIDKAVPRK